MTEKLKRNLPREVKRMINTTMNNLKQNMNHEITSGSMCN